MKLVQVVIIASLFASGLFAQQAEHPGLTLYKQGKQAEAIYPLSLAVKAKEHKNDPIIWNTLGLAYISTKDYESARKALAKAIKLNPANPTFHANLAYVHLVLGDTKRAKGEATKGIELEANNPIAFFIRGSALLREHNFNAAQTDVSRILTIDPAYADAYILGSDIQIRRLDDALLKSGGIKELNANSQFLREAVEILKTGAEKCGDCPNKGVLADRLETINALYDFALKERPTVGNLPELGITPVRFISKPRALYTDTARTASLQGTIRLAVLLGANGKVLYVLALNRLGKGLDENAINAARKIKFEPMMKDGKPISTVVLIEYGFSLY